MTRESIRRFLAEDLSGGGGGQAITDELPLLERQVLDSLGLFELVGYLETEFGVEVVDEELVPTNFATLNDIVRFVEEKQR